LNRRLAAAAQRVAVGVFSAAVLVLTADDQIYDNNLYTLSEATALLLGYRLLSEFVLQWALIIAGVVMAFHTS